MDKFKAQRHFAYGIAAISLLLATTACGPVTKTAEEERQDVLRGIRARYDTYFQHEPPAYVVITYPESSSALTKHGQDVLQIIKSALASRKIPYECSRLEDALTTVTDQRKKAHLTYRIPESRTAKLEGGTLLYINLCMSQDLETMKHPLAAEHDISVRVWNDEYTKDGAKKGTM